MKRKWLFYLFIFILAGCAQKTEIYLDNKLVKSFSIEDSTAQKLVLPNWEIHLSTKNKHDFNGFIYRKNGKMSPFFGQNIDIYLNDSLGTYRVVPRAIRF